MTTLSFETGPLGGRRVRVTSEIVIGRTDADLVVDDAEVSRRHAKIRPEGEVLEIEDLGSTNGTWVNGTRVEGSAQLHPGDQIRVGNTIVSIEVDPSPAAADARSGPSGIEAPTEAIPPAANLPSVLGGGSWVPSRETRGRRRKVASRSAVPTLLAVAVIAATAVALTLYFALRMKP